MGKEGEPIALLLKDTVRAPSFVQISADIKTEDDENKNFDQDA